MNDSLSFIGALDPSIWTSETRLQKFIADLGSSVSNIITSLATGDRTKEGEIRGIKKLKDTFTPAITKQIFKEETKKTETKKLKTPPGLPELPSLKKTLPTPPGLPKLPNL